jgi:hypothetical protein
MKKRIVITIAVIVVVLAGALVLSTSGGRTSFRQATEEPEDFLLYAYGIDEDAEYPDYFFHNQLMVYDIKTRISTPLFSGWYIADFLLNQSNQLAFFSDHSGNYEVYTVPYPFNENEVIQITNAPDTFDYPESWSPDGRYLLVASTNEDKDILNFSIWDGEKITSILQTSGDEYYPVWNENNHLALEIITWGESEQKEIYIWDGKKTIDLSQDYNRSYENPVWGPDGQLAFESENIGMRSVFIWNGKTQFWQKSEIINLTAGLPRIGVNYHISGWTEEGNLLISSYDTNYKFLHAYLWDGKMISETVADSSIKEDDNTLLNQSYWQIGELTSGLGYSIYIYNQEDEIVYYVNTSSSVASSQTGYLLFCEFDDRTWSLMLWNGETVRKIVTNELIVSGWKNGKSVYCNFG